MKKHWNYTFVSKKSSCFLLRHKAYLFSAILFLNGNPVNLSYFFSPSDKSVLATLLNNIPSVIQESNLFEARKKLKSALQIDGSKLTSRQRRTLLLNQVNSWHFIALIFPPQKKKIILKIGCISSNNIYLRHWFIYIRINASRVDDV